MKIQEQKNIKKITSAVSKIQKKPTIEDIYQQEMDVPKNLTQSSIGLMSVLFLLIAAMLSGFLAGVVQDNLFENYYNKGIDINAQVVKNQEEVLDLDFLINEEDNSYNKVLSELKSQIVGFYKKGKVGKNILDSLILEKDFLGSGVIVTSDGWLLTHESVIKNNDYIVVTSDKKIFEPAKEIVDGFSGAMLVKIETDNLSPVRFAEISGLTPTEPLLTTRCSVQNHGSDIVKTSIQKYAYHDQQKGSDFLLTTEKIDHYLKIAKEFEAVYNGASLFNNKNEVAGMLFYSGRDMVNLAIPSYYLKSAIKNFLVNSQEILRGSLGVYYIDLSESLGLDDEVTEGRVNGAVLLGDAGRKILAVAKESAADEAGLEAGDIILKVNNEEIDERNSLTKLIQYYTPGQELTLIIMREGEEMEVKVVLGEL